MNKETVEVAAEKWIDSHYNKGVEYSKAKRGACNPNNAFIAGAEWQKEQNKPSIPTDKEIEEKSKSIGNNGGPFSTRVQNYAYMYQEGYKQALKDLGHE